MGDAAGVALGTKGVSVGATVAVACGVAVTTMGPGMTMVGGVTTTGGGAAGAACCWVVGAELPLNSAIAERGSTPK